MTSRGVGRRDQMIQNGNLMDGTLIAWHFYSLDMICLKIRFSSTGTRVDRDLFDT